MKKIILSVVMLVQAACCMEQVQVNEIIAYYDNLRDRAGVVRQTSFADAIMPDQIFVFHDYRVAIFATRACWVYAEIIKNTHALGFLYSLGVRFLSQTPDQVTIKQLQRLWDSYVRAHNVYAIPIILINLLEFTQHAREFAAEVHAQHSAISFVQAYYFAESCNQSVVCAYDIYQDLITKQWQKIKTISDEHWKPVLDAIFCLACDAAVQGKVLLLKSCMVFSCCNGE